MPLKSWSSKSVMVMRTLLMMAATLGTLAEAGLSRCPEGQFFSTNARSCLACALCPKNQIIRVPCSPHSDTVCGPFFEFYEFHQAPRPTLNTDGLDFMEDTGKKCNSDLDLSHHEGDRFSDPADEGQQGRKQPSSGKSVGAEGQDTNDFEDLGSTHTGGHIHKARDRGSPPSSGGGQEMPRVQTPEEEERQWKVLALALIIVLCVVCIGLILFIFIVCYFRANRSNGKGAFFGSASDSGSVRNRPGAPRYFPLPFWAQTQTATSGPGERRPTAGMTPSRDRQPDRAAESGALQGTASSEYVYFKSPHNGNGGAVDV